MIFSRFIFLAWRNLRRNLRRNIATGLSVAIGFCGMVLIGGYVNRVYHFLQNYTIYQAGVGHVSIYKKEGLDKYMSKPKSFSISELEKNKLRDVLNSFSEIDFVTTHLFAHGLAGNGCKSFPFVAEGIEPPAEKYVREHPLAHRWLKDIQNNAVGLKLSDANVSGTSVVLSLGLARFLNKQKVASEFPGTATLSMPDCSGEQIQTDANLQLVGNTWDGRMTALDADVIGLYSTGVTESENTFLKISLEKLQELLETKNVTSISVWLKSIADVDSVFSRLVDKVQQENLSLDVYKWDDKQISPYFSGTIQFLKVIILFLGSVLLSIITFSIFNSVTLNLLERSQEIGMFRSLGYAQKHLNILIALESLMVTVLGLLLGAFIAVAITMIVNNAHIRFNPPGIAGGLQLMLIPNFLVFFVSVSLITVFSSVATWIAARVVVRRGVSQLLAEHSR